MPFQGVGSCSLSPLHRRRRDQSRAKVPPASAGPGPGYDFDVFDGEPGVGRIFRQANGAWFWGVRFQLTGVKSYGTAPTLDAAKAAFKVEYERWSEESGLPA